METNYITVPEAAEHLRLPLNRVYLLCKKRSFPAVKFGNCWRINKSALDEWFMKQLKIK